MKYRRGSLQVGLLHKSWIHAAQETPALAGSELATSLATLNESVLVGTFYCIHACPLVLSLDGILKGHDQDWHRYDSVEEPKGVSRQGT